MKKFCLILAFILTLSYFTACGVPTLQPTLSPTPSSLPTTTPEVTPTPELLPTPTPDANEEKILLNSVEGLNEQIHLSLTPPKSGELTVYYKASEDDEYSVLDRELMLTTKTAIDCYILGLKKGLYDVKIELDDDGTITSKTVTDIDVEKQDRSGYAHFKREEGIGGYNNDGTVKDDAIILYVTNANKNTITLDINGTTYTGLVAILEAANLLEHPLIVRVLDKITTNQWKPRDAGKRYTDEETHDENFLTNSFTAFGENLAGLTVDLYDSKVGKIMRYITVTDGIKYLGDIKYKIETREENGREYYLDRYQIYNINIEYANNITIEGVGANATFYQFGVNFIYCNSIEVKNITFSKYTEDGLNLLGFDHTTEYGGYWIHNNTFGTGYNAWTLPGLDLPSDEALALCDINSATVSYNKFDSPYMAIIMGSDGTDAQLNVTIHHNHFYNVAQRTPLVRNTNLHNYNNYYHNCRYAVSPRSNTYLFSESNFFACVFNYYSVEAEPFSAVKSYNDIYAEYADEIGGTTIVTDRDAFVPNTCKPDWETDYSCFDTDPELFYYDVENGCTDVDLMHDAKNVPAFVEAYAGAGVYKKLDLSK